MCASRREVGPHIGIRLHEPRHVATGHDRSLGVSDMLVVPRHLRPEARTMTDENRIRTVSKRLLQPGHPRVVRHPVTCAVVHVEQDRPARRADLTVEVQRPGIVKRKLRDELADALAPPLLVVLDQSAEVGLGRVVAEARINQTERNQARGMERRRGQHLLRAGPPIPSFRTIAQRQQNRPPNPPPVHILD